MRAHNVPLFITHFFIKNSGRVLEKSFAPPLSRLIKKRKTQHCAGSSFFGAYSECSVFQNAAFSYGK